MEKRTIEDIQKEINKKVQEIILEYYDDIEKVVVKIINKKQIIVNEVQEEVKKIQEQLKEHHLEEQEKKEVKCEKK